MHARCKQAEAYTIPCRLPQGTIRMRVDHTPTAWSPTRTSLSSHDWRCPVRTCPPQGPAALSLPCPTRLQGHRPANRKRVPSLARPFRRAMAYRMQLQQLNTRITFLIVSSRLGRLPVSRLVGSMQWLLRPKSTAREL